MKNEMYTPAEAFYAVRDRKLLEKVNLYEDDSINIACNAMIDHINNGWLGCNLRHLNLKMSEEYRVTKFLTKLGYKVDKDFIVYWLYNPLIYRFRK